MTWQTVGFEKNKQFFEKVITADSVGHAYLFSGQEMIGKKTFALELARFLNEYFLFLDQNASESSQTIGIDSVRKVKEHIALTSFSGKTKVVVIDNAHLMTEEAQNSLLKVLEEPFGKTVFMLISANPEALLATIASRCQEIKFQPHPAAVVRKFLTDLKVPPNQIDFLVKFSNGRLGLIKTAVESAALPAIKKDIEELAGLVKFDLNDRLIKAQHLSDQADGEKLRQKLLCWLLYLRTKMGEPKIDKVIRGLLTLYQKLNQPQLNRRLALENFLINL